jgi:hypothetical protein
VHLVCGDSADSALFDDFRIFATGFFDFEHFFDDKLQDGHQLAIFPM